LLMAEPSSGRPSGPVNTSMRRYPGGGGSQLSSSASGFRHHQRPLDSGRQPTRGCECELRFEDRNIPRLIDIRTRPQLDADTLRLPAEAWARNSKRGGRHEETQRLSDAGTALSGHGHPDFGFRFSMWPGGSGQFRRDAVADCIGKSNHIPNAKSGSAASQPLLAADCGSSCFCHSDADR
jgi:hypothetical protein